MNSARTKSMALVTKKNLTLKYLLVIKFSLSIHRTYKEFLKVISIPKMSLTNHSIYNLVSYNQLIAQNTPSKAYKPHEVCLTL